MFSCACGHPLELKKDNISGIVRCPGCDIIKSLHFEAVDDPAVDSIPRPEENTFYGTTLNPGVWLDADLKNGEAKIKPELREKLNKIGNDFFSELNLQVPIEDIQLTGSMSNYNWNKFSDLDVHVLIDFSKLGKELDFIKKALDGQRFIWNLRHNVIIDGHEVELYIQDVKEPHIASGLYSLMNDKWITIPKYNPPQVDARDVEMKYKGITNDIDSLEKFSKEDLKRQEDEDYYRRAGEIKKKIANMRAEGLKREGEFSVENLAFKKLRNSGYIEKIINLQTYFYDQIYSE